MVKPSPCHEYSYKLKQTLWHLPFTVFWWNSNRPFLFLKIWRSVCAYKSWRIVVSNGLRVAKRFHRRIGLDDLILQSSLKSRQCFWKTKLIFVNNLPKCLTTSFKLKKAQQYSRKHQDERVSPTHSGFWLRRRWIDFRITKCSDRGKILDHSLGVNSFSRSRLSAGCIRKIKV